MRWYDRPHDGAQATEVIEYGVGTWESGSIVAGAPATVFAAASRVEFRGVGRGPRVNSAVELLGGESWMICVGYMYIYRVRTWIL